MQSVDEFIDIFILYEVEKGNKDLMVLVFVSFLIVCIVLYIDL